MIKSVILLLHRRVMMGTVLVSGLLALTGCWRPQMVHPGLYSSGRVLPEHRVEFGAQLFPGITLGLGLPNGAELRGNYGYTGGDILGGGFEFSKEVLRGGRVWIAATAGADWFRSESRTYNGHRFMFGGTLSWYTKSGRFGLHFPIRGYYMTYVWKWDEGEVETSPVVDDSAEGYVFVTGIGISIEGKHLAWKLGVNGPDHENIGRVELVPNVGTQLSVRF